MDKIMDIMTVKIYVKQFNYIWLLFAQLLFIYIRENDKEKYLVWPLFERVSLEYSLEVNSVYPYPSSRIIIIILEGS